jgi:hypothetical protein
MISEDQEPLTDVVSASPLANPWLGLASYSESDSAMFFGREKETAELLRLINREALTVVFGRSGLGKTSLLRAGVIPRLRESAYFPVALRLDYSDRGLSPVEQAKALVREAAMSAGLGVENGSNDNPETTLWEFFHTVELWSPRNDLLTPILLIDQFEEVFTLGRNVSAVAEFLVQLADLIENRVPRSLQERVEGSGKPLGIDTEIRNYKVVLSLREDFVSKLDSLRSSMPAIMRNRFALEPLSGERALSIIVRAGGHWVTEEVARDIVAAVAGRNDSGDSALDFASYAEIEPAYLSVMCYELFQRMADMGDHTITHDLVMQEHGGILEGLYERSFVDLAPNTRLFVEDHLLTSSGFRAAVPVAEAIADGLSAHDLDTLVDRRLLRFEDRLGTQHIELSHDLLTSVVLKSRDLRRAQEVQLEERHRRAEVRRAFRSRVIAALSAAAAAVVVLSALTIWALRERTLANQARNQAEINAANITGLYEQLRHMDEDLHQEANENELQRKKAVMQAEQLRQKNHDLIAEKQKTQQLADKTLESFRVTSESSYEDSLEAIELYDERLDENVKDKLVSSLRAHRKNLNGTLKSIDEVLKATPDNAEAVSLKMDLLFAVADTDFKTYAFNEKEYGDFLAYTRQSLNTKNGWQRAKAMRMLDKAVGMMYRKGDKAAANELLKEIWMSNEQLHIQSTGSGISARTWDALEDVYEDCANLQKAHDPQDARKWFNLAEHAEESAARLDRKYANFIARIYASSGGYEAEQNNNTDAIREYTSAIAASKELLRIQHTDAETTRTTTQCEGYLIARGDIKMKEQHLDIARKDYEEARDLSEKLVGSQDDTQNRMSVMERLGDLEMAAKNPSKALEWYSSGLQIATVLAKDDHRQSGLPDAYSKIRAALQALGNAKEERAELEKAAAAFEQWSTHNDETCVKNYINALVDLADFESDQNEHKDARQYADAQKNYDAAVKSLRRLTNRWPSSDNFQLQWQVLLKASDSESKLHQTDMAQRYLQQSQVAADSLLQPYREAATVGKELIVKNCVDNLTNFQMSELRLMRALDKMGKFEEARNVGQDTVQTMEGHCLAVEKSADKGDKTHLADFWGGMSYSFLLAREDKLALDYANKGLALDKNEAWIKVNLAHAYLFNGKVDEAKHLYAEIKDVKWGDHLLQQDIRDDFKELQSLGRELPAMGSILQMLRADGK